MNNIKKISLLLGLTISCFSLFAQGKAEDKRERMEKLRQEFIMERMDLSEEESRKLKSIEKEYREELRSTRAGEERMGRRMRSEFKENGMKAGSMSEEEARKILTERLAREEDRLVLEKKYTQKMIEEISAKKTLEYKLLDREFKKELLRMLKSDERDHHLREEFIKRRLEEDRELEAD